MAPACFGRGGRASCCRYVGRGRRGYGSLARLRQQQGCNQGQRKHDSSSVMSAKRERGDQSQEAGTLPMPGLSVRRWRLVWATPREVSFWARVGARPGPASRQRLPATAVVRPAAAGRGPRPEPAPMRSARACWPGPDSGRARARPAPPHRPARERLSRPRGSDAEPEFRWAIPNESPHHVRDRSVCRTISRWPRVRSWAANSSVLVARRLARRARPLSIARAIPSTYETRQTESRRGPAIHAA